MYFQTFPLIGNLKIVKIINTINSVKIFSIMCLNYVMNVAGVLKNIYIFYCHNDKINEIVSIVDFNFYALI